MSLSDRIAEYKPPRIGGSCKVCVILETVAEKDSAALRVALEDARISNAGLAHILKAEGFQIQETTVRRHRRSECRRES